MNAEFATHLLNFVLNQKHSILLEGLCDVPAIVDRTLTVTADNLGEAVERITSRSGGFFRDPKRLLDPAIVDKMIVV